MTTYSKETALYDTGAIKNGIDEAATTADNYLTDVTGGGVMVHPSDDSTSGWKISSALELLKSGISYIWAGLVNNIATVRIGKESGGHSIIDENGMRVYGDSTGSAQLANIGYGPGKSESGTIVPAPYYNLGIRKSGPVIGNYSVIEGYNNAAPFPYGHAEGYNTTAGYMSHAEGRDTDANGRYSHASGHGTIASYAQTVIGEYNQSQGGTGSRSDSDFVFIIGNGTSDSNRSNAFAIDWKGNVFSSAYYGSIPSALFIGSATTATSCTNGVWYGGNHFTGWSSKTYGTSEDDFGKGVNGIYVKTAGYYLATFHAHFNGTAGDAIQSYISNNTANTALTPTAYIRLYASYGDIAYSNIIFVDDSVTTEDGVAIVPQFGRYSGSGNVRPTTVRFTLTRVSSDMPEITS